MHPVPSSITVKTADDGRLHASHCRGRALFGWGLGEGYHVETAYHPARQQERTRGGEGSTEEEVSR